LTYGDTVGIIFQTVDTAPANGVYFATYTTNGDTAPHSTSADETLTCWGLSTSGSGLWPGASDWTYFVPDDGAGGGSGKTDVQRVAWYETYGNYFFRIELGGSMTRQTYYAIMLDSDQDGTNDYLIEWHTANEVAQVREWNAGGPSWDTVDGDHLREYDTGSAFIEWGVSGNDVGLTDDFFDSLTFAAGSNPDSGDYESNTMATFSADDRGPDSGSYSSSGVVIINEIAVNGDHSNEWVELYVISGGTDLGSGGLGLILSDQDGNSKTFPSFTPATGDYIVVHITSGTDDTVKTDNNAGYWDLYMGKGAGIFDDSDDDVLLTMADGMDDGTDPDPLDYAEFGSTGDDDIPASNPYNIAWTGTNPSAPGSGATISRIPNGKDSDATGDWTVTGSGDTTEGGENVPEFDELVVPVFTIIALFMVVRWRRRKYKDKA